MEQQFGELTTQELPDTSGLAELMLDEDEKKRQQGEKPVSNMIQNKIHKNAITQMI